MRAPAEVARLLDIKSGDSVIFIRRVQSFDGVPTILEELWLPGALFRGLTAERLVEYKGPMYGLFETEFGTRMIRATERVRAVRPSRRSRELLNVRPARPCSAWNGCRSLMATSRWRCAAVCIVPIRIIIITN